MPRFLVDVVEWSVLRWDDRTVYLKSPISVQLSASEEGYLFEYDLEDRAVMGCGDDIDSARVDFVVDFMTNLDMEEMVGESIFTDMVERVEYE